MSNQEETTTTTEETTTTQTGSDSAPGEQEAPNESGDEAGALVERKLFKLSDDFIGMVRELVQLSLLTGTNIVDHMRSLVFEASLEEPGKVTVCPEYVDAYNKMVSTLNDDAEAKIEG